jgi:hypothetical protein
MTKPNAPTLQIVFDAADPHAQAEFWAQALRYEVEDHSPVVQALLDGGRLPEAATTRTARGLAFADVAALHDPSGSRPRVFFQRVPEPKTAKNRVHLDIQVGADHADAEADRLAGLGATRAWESDDRGVRCITMRDPEGNEFDVC